MDENTKQILIYIYVKQEASRGRRRRDRIVVGLTTTNAMSAYHH